MENDNNLASVIFVTRFVTISGSFEAVDRVLNFNGKTVLQVSYINGGKPCQLTGPAVFKASGARKYWRLQSMLNCDGATTDYIDIYF